MSSVQEVVHKQRGQLLALVRAGIMLASEYPRLMRSPCQSRPIVAAFLYLQNVPSSSRELRVIQIFCYTKNLLRARYTQERHSIRVLKAVRRP